MKVQSGRFGLPLFAALGLLLMTSCSSSGTDDGDEGTARLAHRMCGTDISTAPVTSMYPGPYTEAFMHVPKHKRGIHGVRASKGKTVGECIIDVVQKKGDVYSSLTAMVRVYPRESAESLHEGYEHQFNSDDSVISLGPARGHVGHEYAQLVRACDRGKGDATEEPFAVLSEFYFDDPPMSKLSEDDMNKYAAAQVANMARYVGSSVLKCSGPKLPGGAPTMTKNE